MKKRFFGILLMGAMVVASMSMFTSCKDYDDDINKLQSQIDAITAQNLQSQIATLQSALTTAQSAATAAQSAADAAATAAKNAQGTADAADKAAKAAQATADAAAKAQEVADLKTAIEDLQKIVDGKVEDLNTAIAGVEAKIAAIDGKLLTLDDVNKLLAESGFATNAAIADMDSQIKTLEAYKKALEGAGLTAATVAEQVKKINDAIATLNDIKGKYATSQSVSEVKTLAQQAADAVSGVTGSINTLTVFVEKRLTSLVFRPDFYWDGIEAIECPAIYRLRTYTLVDNKLAGKGNASDASKGETWTYLPNKAKTGDSLYTYVPDAEATYHMNPSTADITGQKYEFYSNIAAVRTRGTLHNTLATPAGDGIIKATDYKDGFLTVKFKPEFDYIYKLANSTHQNYMGYGYFNINNLYIYDNQAGGNVIDTLSIGSNYWTGIDVYKWMADSAAMVALKVSVADTMVVSDYARLAPSFYESLTLADKTWANTSHSQGYWDLFRTAYGRINAGEYWYNSQACGVHKIKFDSKLNLDAVIQTHYVQYDMNYDNLTAWHEVMSDEVREKLGLFYKYAIIDYTKGNNETGESKHIELVVENDSTYAYPRNVTDKGETIKGKTANASAAGREPVIRVTLEDAAGHIYAVGYEKIRIVEDEVVVENKTVDFDLTGPYYMNCGADATLTWSQIEYHIYNDLLGISKSTFENTYRPVSWGTDSQGRILRQFAIDKDGKYNMISASDTIWTVRQTTTDTQATMTQVLKWHFDANQIANINKIAKFGSNGLSTADLTTIVAFENYNTGARIYVTLKVPATKLAIATGTLGKKLKAYWYDIHNNVANSGVKEIHATAGDPDRNEAAKAGGVTCKKADDGFEFDITSTFFGNKLGVEIDNAKAFSKFTDDKLNLDLKFTTPQKDVNAAFSADKGEWKVTGQSGKEYTLKLNGKYEIVTATTTPVVIAELKKATTGPSAGKYVIMSYKDNAEAKDILNYAIHSDMASKKTFQVYVEAQLESDVCYNPIMSERYFNVRVVRPITVEGLTGKSITDAAGTQIINLSDFVKFYDWRDLWKFWYYDYYGVQLKYNLNNIRTDIADPAAVLAPSDIASIEKLDKLKDATTKLALKNAAGTATGTVTWTANWTKKTAVAGGDDAITYDHNEASTADFHLYIPVTVSYFWGDETQKFYAVITVKKTQGGGNAVRQK